MTVLPHASGIAIARTPRITGAFQGAMPSTTPAGCRMAIARLPGTSEGMISPPICVVMAPASRNMPAAKCTLKCPQPAVAPVSAITVAANCAERDSSRSAAFSSFPRRSVGPSADHPGNAAAAASAALQRVLDRGGGCASHDLAGHRILPRKRRAVCGRHVTSADHQLNIVHVCLLNPIRPARRRPRQRPYRQAYRTMVTGRGDGVIQLQFRFENGSIRGGLVGHRPQSPPGNCHHAGPAPCGTAAGELARPLAPARPMGGRRARRAAAGVAADRARVLRPRRARAAEPHRPGL